MRKGTFLHFACVVLFVLVGCISVYSQNISLLIDFVDGKNKSQVDKAIKAISEAGEKTQEANSYYNEALSLQSNLELDEKTLQKKLEKAEEKAIALQVEADKLYSSAYKTLYEVCQDVLSQSAVSYGDTEEMKKSASEMMNKAEIKREEAKNNKNVYEKATMLNEAAGYEAAAIDNLISAIQIQNGITPSEPDQNYSEEPYTQPEKYNQTAEYTKSTSAQQKNGNLTIDQNLVHQYNEYVNDPTVPEPILIDRNGVHGIDDVSVDHARAIIYNYQYGSDYINSEQALYPPASQKAIQDSITELASTDLTAESQSANESLSTEQNNPTETLSPDITSETKAGKETTAYKETSTNTHTVYNPAAAIQATDVIFMVQVAASRIPLTRAQLWAISPGNFTVQVVQEGNWFKYRVTGFRLYSEANRVAMESGVRDAFVVAYRQGNPLNLVEARDMTRVMESDVKRYGRKALSNSVDYYVQVIASRTRLDDNALIQFCGTGGACREVIEEGWFKYQIYAGTEYAKALELKNQLDKKSFIVAYDQGTKQNLYKAIHKNK